VKRHVYPRTVVSVGYHYKNPTMLVDLVQRGHHYHLIKIHLVLLHDIAEKLLIWG